MTDDRKIIELDRFLEEPARNPNIFCPRCDSTYVVLEEVNGEGWNSCRKCGYVYRYVLKDPDYCGLGAINTGKYDPFWKLACESHDQAMQKLKDTGQGSNTKTFLAFTGEVIEGMATGLYEVVSGPFYIIFGGIGGLFRWNFITPKGAVKGNEIEKKEAWED